MNAPAITKQRTCIKKQYRDEVAAKFTIAMIRTKKHTRRPKEEVRAYRCPNCKKWHITSKG